MLIIRFQGGIGNQLFQYALYRRLEEMGLEVKADLTTYSMQNEIRQFKLEQAFGINLKVAAKQEIWKLSGGERNFFEKCVRKFLKANLVYKEERIQSLEQIAGISNGYINGYWQSSRWFEDINDILRKELIFQTDDEAFCKKCNEVANEQSVSIHIRLGDYLKLETLYGGICTREYYQKAIEYINNKVFNPHFYVISDEPEKAKQLLPKTFDAEYVSYPIDYWDMQFMSSCRHNILANSSFSWWSTWLNRHPDKIVVSPSKWNNWQEPQDVFEPNWVKF